jgi:hypothetical protein
MVHGAVQAGVAILVVDVSHFEASSVDFPSAGVSLQTTSCSFWLIRKQVAAMFVVVFGSIQTRPKSSNPKVGTSTFHGACKFQPQLC